MEDKVDLYFSKIGAPRNFDPLAWWKANSSCYPCLSQLVKPLFAIPGTSTNSERLFLGAGQGRIQNFAKGGPWLMAMVYIVCSTISMQSMLMLGGSGGMPPQKNLKN